MPSTANSANIGKFDEEKKKETGGESRRKEARVSKSANEFITNALKDSCELRAMSYKDLWSWGVEGWLCSWKDLQT